MSSTGVHSLPLFVRQLLCWLSMFAGVCSLHAALHLFMISLLCRDRLRKVGKAPDWHCMTLRDVSQLLSKALLQRRLGLRMQHRFQNLAPIQPMASLLPRGCACTRCYTPVIMQDRYTSQTSVHIRPDEATPSSAQAWLTAVGVAPIAVIAVMVNTLYTYVYCI